MVCGIAAVANAFKIRDDSRRARVLSGPQGPISMELKLLPTLKGPADLKALPVDRLPQVASEIRHAMCEQIKNSGGHFAPNLGVVELTIAR